MSKAEPSERDRQTDRREHRAKRGDPWPTPGQPPRVQVLAGNEFANNLPGTNKVSTFTDSGVRCCSPVWGLLQQSLPLQSPISGRGRPDPTAGGVTSDLVFRRRHNPDVGSGWMTGACRPPGAQAGPAAPSGSWGDDLWVRGCSAVPSPGSRRAKRACRAGDTPCQLSHSPGNMEDRQRRTRPALIPQVTPHPRKQVHLGAGLG